MEHHDFELRLIGNRAPRGEILFGDLASLSAALQQLATRIGRYVVELSGPGRTPTEVERTTRLRLRGLQAGSTRLLVAYGDPDVLPMDLGLERESAARFWEVVQAIPTGARPSWVTPLVANSALAVVDALGDAASAVEFHREGEPAVTIATAHVSREPWVMGTESPTDALVSVSGRLEAVDLKTSRFRIRDDVGNAISLRDVADAEVAAALVGQRTTATGQAILGSRGQVSGLNAPSLAPAPLPEQWRPGQTQDWAVALSAPGPDPAGINGFTGQDVDDFLAQLRD